jgi:FKBP-type peptidyl-prolyl cis-trans isomerase (trigger factor)
MNMLVLKKKRPLYAIFIFCVALMVAIGCNKKDSAAPSGSTEGNAAKPAAQKPAVSKSDPAKVLVEVDGKKFTQTEADKEIDMKLASAMGQLPEDQMAELRPKMLTETVEDFVTRTLLGEAADREKVNVSDAEIQDTIDKIKKSLPQGMTFKDALQRSGITEEKLRADIALGLRVNKLVEAQEKDKNPPSDK